MPLSTPPGLIDPRASVILVALGAPYVWGAGSLARAPLCGPAGDQLQAPDGHLVRGWDCSGFAQWALYTLGIVKEKAWVDLRARDIAEACDGIDVKAGVLGDLYFYGTDIISHITVSLGGGMCLGANGGGRHTFANDPRARVEARSVTYRPDLICAGRLKAQYRKVP